MRRRRTTTGTAVGALLVAALQAGCAPDSEPIPPGADAVPTTLAPRPTPRPQPSARIRAEQPTYVLGGAGRQSAEVVWNQSLDLIRNWLLNPELMKSHPVREVTELDGLVRLMTPRAGERWQRITHRALRGYVDPYPAWAARRHKDHLAVHQLVAWNLPPRPGRSWDNPMMSPVRITDAHVTSTGQTITAIFRMTTTYRLVGRDVKYDVPTTGIMGLVWMQDDGAWKLDAWWRSGHADRERRHAAKAESASPSAKPSRAPATPGSGALTPVPSLYPD